MVQKTFLWVGIVFPIVLFANEAAAVSSLSQRLNALRGVETGVEQEVGTLKAAILEIDDMSFSEAVNLETQLGSELSKILVHLRNEKPSEEVALKLREDGRIILRDAITLALRMSTPRAGLLHWFESHHKIANGLMEVFTVATAILAVDYAIEKYANWFWISGYSVTASIIAVLAVSIPFIKFHKFRQNRRFNRIFSAFESAALADLPASNRNRDINLSDPLQYPSCNEILKSFWRTKL